MDLNLVIKALGNPMRLQIIQWLKSPKLNFPVETQLVDADIDGVCVSIIQEKSGLSQSTISVYLATLQRAGLVNVKRIGPWTYYQRNEANIALFLAKLAQDL
jgi:ArsR family transcriptional regulator